MSKPLPRVGSAVLVVDGDRILLGRRAKDPNRGKWVLPGGKIEPFESISEAAAREIKEETGLTVRVLRQVGTFEIITPPDEHRLIVFSEAVPIDGDPEPASDLSDLRFCSREELPLLDLSDFIRHVLTEFEWIRKETAVPA